MSQTMPPLHRGVRCLVSVVAVVLLLTGGGVGLPARSHADERRDHRQHRLAPSSERGTTHEQRLAPSTERVTNRTYDVTNVTVTDRTPVVHQQVGLRVTVANHAAEERTVDIEVHLGDTLLAERSVTLPSNDTRTVTVEISPPQPGTQVLTVAGHDAGTLTVRAQPSNREFGLLYIAIGATTLALLTATVTAAYFERT